MIKHSTLGVGVALSLVLMVVISSAQQSSSYYGTRLHENRRSGSTNDLPPFIFCGGYSSLTLRAEIDADAPVPAGCPKGTNVTLFLNLYYSLNPFYAKCMYYYMQTAYNETTKTFTNSPGVRVFTVGFGETTESFDSLPRIGDPHYYNMVDHFVKEWGYVSGRNLRFAPYDWTKSTASLDASGYYDDLMRLIEDTYYANGKRRVVLSGHSYGGPVAYGFLQRMSQEWKDTYISAFIGLSGTWGGQINNLGFMFGQSSDVIGYIMDSKLNRLVQASWGSNAFMLAYPPLYGSRVIATIAGKNYTAADQAEILRMAGFEQMAQTFTDVNPDNALNMNATNVDSYCFYGSNVKTSDYFVWKTTDLTSEKPTIYYGDGDGNQDITTNRGCLGWKDTMAPGYHFEYQEFSGVTHLEMVDHPDVLAAVYSVLQNAK